LPKSIFGPSGSRGNFKTMFISDEHVLLDILPTHINYADRPAASIAQLRVIADAAARGVLEKPVGAIEHTPVAWGDLDTHV